MSFRFLFALLAGMILPLQALGAGVVINEVLYNPTGTDSGYEWIELYNSDSVSRDISGWELYPDGIGYAIFPANTIIPGNGFLTVHLRSQGVNSVNDFYYNAASITANMGNTSGSVALFSAEPRSKDTMKSFVEWGKAGETWEADAEKAGLWTKGLYIDTANISEGNSIGLIMDGVSVNGKDAWRIFLSPTMGTANSISSHDSQSASTQSSSVAAQSISSSSLVAGIFGIEPPTIKAYAGEDKTVSVGTLVQFDGRATGLKNELLTGERLWWNFGDGVTSEGAHASHIFSIPGVYLVGLHASDDIAAGSDYAKITVVPNQLSLTRVIDGENGFIQITNPTSFDIDVGGWIVSDADGKQFIIPDQTKISGHADVAFSNTVTGLLRGAIRYPISVRYANAVIAMTTEHALNAVEHATSVSTNVVRSQTVSAVRSLASVVPAIMQHTTLHVSSSTSSSTVPKNSFGSHAVWLGIGALSIVGALSLFFIPL